MLNSGRLTKKYAAVGIMFLAFVLLFVFDVKSQAEPNNTADAEPNEVTQPQPEPEAEAAETFENKIIDTIEVQGNIYISSEKILAMTRSREGYLPSPRRRKTSKESQLLPVLNLRITAHCWRTEK